MKIAIIGTGYVGLVSGACLADTGHDVTCVDLNMDRVNGLNTAKAPFLEAGLDDLLQKCVGTSLRATSDLGEAISDAKVIFIACGTPFDGRTIDLGQVKQVASEIAAGIKSRTDFPVVVVKSTVVPGTTKDVVAKILSDGSGLKLGSDFGLAVNPEFLREGTAVEDFMAPDRIVVGASDTQTSAIMSEVYQQFSGVPYIETDFNTAELIKYSTNALLATMVSFANEVTGIGRALGGMNIDDWTAGLFSDKRFVDQTPDGKPVLTSYLKPGCGFGGSCLPKDIKALASASNNLGQPARLLNAVIDVNREQPGNIVKMLDDELSGVDGKTIAIFGLAFKPDTDDCRESPAIPIITELASSGATVKLHDPVVQIGNLGLPHGLNAFQVASIEEALDSIDAAILVTFWSDYAVLPDLVGKTSSTPIFMDPRNVFNKNQFTNYLGLDSLIKQN